MPAMFLRDMVPDAALLPALAEVFDASEQENLTVVDYTEGFATGIGSERMLRMPAHEAARILARRLGTEVLLEADATEKCGYWLLFVPGGFTREVRVVELRHGLSVVPVAPAAKRRTPAAAPYAAVPGF